MTLHEAGVEFCQFPQEKKKVHLTKQWRKT